MSERVVFPRRGSYGIDAPYVFGGLTVLCAVFLVFAIVNGVQSGRWWAMISVGFMLFILGFVYHTTLRGKFLVWSELLDKLNLRGDERILDMGCGRGAVLLMAAQHLTTGRAVGVDLWRGYDQSGNNADATRRNAEAEGVSDRVELHTGDMTKLPFENESFDVVVSSLAIHNIPGQAGREKAVDEAVRVLQPGGRLLIADIQSTGRHESHLAKIGMESVVRKGLGWRFWWGGPWASTKLVTATKPR
jgi:arsenite methyltransferase